MLGSHCAMSPGARTIPAAMVLPTAAEIPNHMPRTLRRRPRPAEAMESKVPLDAEPLGVEDRSEVFGNCRVSGTLRNFAMIMGTGEKASRNWRNLKMELCTEELRESVRCCFGPCGCFLGYKLFSLRFF